MDAREDREAWARTAGAQGLIVNQGCDRKEEEAIQPPVHRQQSAATPGGPRRIANQRAALQTRALVFITGLGLAVGVACLLRHFVLYAANREPITIAAALSFTLALAVWALRAGTAGAACAGGAICLLLVSATIRPAHSLFASALTPLVMLFVLTFLATRLGRQRKLALGLAEPPEGRRTAQVLANLGAAGLIASAALILAARASPPAHLPATFAPVLILAALAEATADTVSSEIGQAFGGTPRLLTRFKPVPPGTDGAVSLLGTSAGIIAAAIVTLSGILAFGLDFRAAGTIFLAAVAGLFFDSLLGATAERRGFLNNDLVNFSSTLFAVLVAWVIHRFF